jgi:ADP-ribose pyrophosphatase YjhB (NUDIX family)
MAKPVIHVVINIIHYGDLIVVVKQVEDKEQKIQVNADGKKDFLLGFWHLPGGKAEAHESLEQAAVRETYEETGLKVVLRKQLGERVEEREKAVLHLHWYACEAQSMNLKPGDDADDAQFVPRIDVPQYCAQAVIDQWPDEVRAHLGMALR